MSRRFKLDDEYLKMLDLLKHNPRVSHAELAKKIGISETAIRRRMGRLVEGDFVHISAVANQEKLGFQLQIWTGIRIVAGRVDDVVGRLNELEEINYMALVTGNYDIIFTAWFRNVEELRWFATDKLGKIPGITSTDTYLILEALLGPRGERRVVSTSHVNSDEPNAGPTSNGAMAE